MAAVFSNKGYDRRNMKNTKSLKTYSLLFLMLLISSACTESQLIRISGTTQASDIIINQPDEVQVEVFFEESAAPRVGLNSSGIDAWSILEDNLFEIYRGKKAQQRLFVPKTLSEMTRISDQQVTTWSTQDITRLAFESQITPQSLGRVVFVVLFLNGVLATGERNGTGTIGLSIGNTRIIAIFQDVIDRASGSEDVKMFMEQSTLVHEMGHAIGLVNRGIPLTTEHLDELNGAHCTNTQCTMFWLNEGAADLEAFVARYIESGSTILFGEECLRDIREFSL